MSETTPRGPIKGYYDGAFYARLVAPIAADLHRLVGKAIPDNASLLDACCGPGALVFQCASRCRHVLGVDLSPNMIDYAERDRQKRGCDNVEFRVGDVGHLPDIEDRAFEYATIIMALHEMPHEARPSVLPELARVAENVIVVDFIPRQRWNYQGVRNRIMEVIGGPRHFAGFRDFCRRGGLPPLIRDAGLETVRQGVMDAGNLEIHTLRAPNPS